MAIRTRQQIVNTEFHNSGLQTVTQKSALILKCMEIYKDQELALLSAGYKTLSDENNRLNLLLNQLMGENDRLKSALRESLELEPDLNGRDIIEKALKIR